MTTQTLSLGSKPVIEIANVGGDLAVQGWERTDLEARSDDSPRIEQDGDEVTLSCGGDLSVSIPRGASLNISYVGGDLKAKDLDAAVEVSFVGGDVKLQDMNGPVSLEGVIGGETQTENVRKVTLGAQRAGVGVDISARVQRKMDEAMRRAERATRRAEQKMTRIMSHQAGHHVPQRHWNVGVNAADVENANEPVSDEERMVILKMLQEKKITSEEADKLLAALEGGG